jgi:hypothetical protein
MTLFAFADRTFPNPVLLWPHTGYIEVELGDYHGEDGLMATAEALDLTVLYEQDETAWLEAMACLAASGRIAEMDCAHLSEYLADMAKRDKREVFSRLVVLLAHLLKWEHQPQRRSGSWRGTIREQRRELKQLLTSGSLRNHAEAVLADAYAEARRQAADESELSPDAFPVEDSRGLDELLAEPDAE